MADLRAMLQQSLTAQVAKQGAQIFELVAHNKILDNQVAQLAASNASRAPGSLPQQGTQPYEIINVITLRSGAAYEGLKIPVEPEMIVVNDAEPAPRPVEKKIEIKVPLPDHLKKKSLSEEQFEKFKEVLAKLNVTIPFLDLVMQVPSYAKFLKELLTRKWSLAEVETVAFTKECSAHLQSSTPKLSNPGSFSISCSLGTLGIDKLFVIWVLVLVYYLCL
ncbi:hypothetical protein vseg_013499 [Gypsophila vaccaria]